MCSYGERAAAAINAFARAFAHRRRWAAADANGINASNPTDKANKHTDFIYTYIDLEQLYLDECRVLLASICAFLIYVIITMIRQNFRPPDFVQSLWLVRIVAALYRVRSSQQIDALLDARWNFTITIFLHISSDFHTETHLSEASRFQLGQRHEFSRLSVSLHSLRSQFRPHSDVIQYVWCVCARRLTHVIICIWMKILDFSERTRLRHSRSLPNNSNRHWRTKPTNTNPNPRPTNCRMKLCAHYTPQTVYPCGHHYKCALAQSTSGNNMFV